MTVAAFVCIVATLEVRSNVKILAQHELSHDTFNWMDILGIVTPISSGITSAVAFYLLATNSFGNVLRKLLHLTLAFGVLLIPPILEKQSFAMTGFSPSGASVMPTVFNIIGGLSLLFVCGG